MKKNKLLNVLKYILIVFAILLPASQSLATGFLPGFSLYNPVDKEVIQTESFYGQSVLLVFMANSQQDQALDIATINRINDKYGDKNLRVVVIGLDFDEVSALTYIAKNRPNFEVMLPHENVVINPGYTPLPLFLLLNEELQIIKRHPGKATKNLIRAIENQLTKG